MPNKPDTLYANPIKEKLKFRFDESVTQVFPDMIRRSVPGYASVISLTGALAKTYIQPNTYCYDLGCSLGASTYAMVKNTTHPCSIIAVDQSWPMIETALKQAQQHAYGDNIHWICAPLQAIQIQHASMVVLNFTLQFIPQTQRLDILKHIYQGLCSGGCLLLSEKVCFDDQQEHDILTHLHHEFKRMQGYSNLEISQKREALEEVLRPESPKTHLERLKAAGFDQVIPVFQCFNFMSWVAFKD